MISSLLPDELPPPQAFIKRISVEIKNILTR
jgi:hypothetical protein